MSETLNLSQEEASMNIFTDDTEERSDEIRSIEKGEALHASTI